MSKKDTHAPNRYSIESLEKRVTALEALVEKFLNDANPAASKPKKPPVIKRDKGK